MNFARTRLCLLAAAACAVLLSGCSSVKISTVESTEYISQQRGDVITSGKLSQQTQNVIYTLGSSVDECRKASKECLENILSSPLIEEDQRLAALSEFWLLEAMDLEKTINVRRMTPDEFRSEEGKIESILSAYLEAARYAYAYLFFSGRSISDRALEDRQTQVRDYYNYSVQNAVSLLFLLNSRNRQLFDGASQVSLGGWRLALDTGHVPNLRLAEQRIESIVPDTTLTFDGLRNQYIREGIGARMVLTLADRNPGDTKDKKPWSMTPYLPVSTMIDFKGANLKEVLASRDVTFRPIEGGLESTVTVGGKKVPLGANFSSAYGLWLANSDFATQSLGTVFGKGNVLEHPTLFMMEPYQPNLKTIILVHGLASSPEAWVNAANEILGDEKLRQNYQIWQIYYPTSVPVALNRADIAKLIESAFDAFDPMRRNPASRDVVLVGHSMGGILSRLLVSNSGNDLWNALNERVEMDAEKKKEVRKKLGDVLFFKPLPEVSRAIFLAAPHRGTPYADGSIAKWLAGLVKLPFSIVHRMSEAALIIFGKDVPYDKVSQTGVSNLSAKDPTIQALARLKVSPKVTVHSVIGVEDPSLPLEETSDGIVPYTSSHWEGAVSEKTVTSGHSVQETPQAILEIRRILHEHLAAAGAKKKP